MNTTDFTTIKASREALKNLITEVQDLIAALDTTPEDGVEKWQDSDNLGDYLDQSNESRYAKDEVRRLVNLGLIL